MYGIDFFFSNLGDTDMTDRKYLPDTVVRALGDLRNFGQRERADAIESVLKRAQRDEDDTVKFKKDFDRRQKEWFDNKQFFFARVTGAVLSNGDVEVYMNDASGRPQIVKRAMVDDFAKRCRYDCDDRVFIAKKILYDTRYSGRDNLGDAAHGINKPNPMRPPK